MKDKSTLDKRTGRCCLSREASTENEDSNMETMHELTEAECEGVTGGGGGQTVALFNHNSGVFGASGNPNASAGPGFFFEPQAGPRAVSSAVHFVQSLPF
jgi:hypothetical protein